MGVMFFGDETTEEGIFQASVGGDVSTRWVGDKGEDLSIRIGDFGVFVSTRGIVCRGVGTHGCWGVL